MYKFIVSIFLIVTFASCNKAANEVAAADKNDQVPVASSQNLRLTGKVLSYRVGVMTDLFDDGSEGVYDACTIEINENIPSVPEQIVVYRSQSENDGYSFLEKIGGSFRFLIEADLLQEGTTVMAGGLEDVELHSPAQ